MALAARRYEFAPRRIRKGKDRFTLVCCVASRTQPDTQYAIKREVDSGVLSCACLAWRFHKGPAGTRTCKHLRALQSGVGILRDSGAPAPQGPLRLGAPRMILLDD